MIESITPRAGSAAIRRPATPRHRSDPRPRVEHAHVERRDRPPVRVHVPAAHAEGLHLAAVRRTRATASSTAASAAEGPPLCAPRPAPRRSAARRTRPSASSASRRASASKASSLRSARATRPTRPAPTTATTRRSAPSSTASRPSSPASACRSRSSPTRRHGAVPHPRHLRPADRRRATPTKGLTRAGSAAILARFNDCASGRAPADAPRSRRSPTSARLASSRRSPPPTTSTDDAARATTQPAGATSTARRRAAARRPSSSRRRVSRRRARRSTSQCIESAHGSRRRLRFRRRRTDGPKGTRS